jgi:hypothetical protein
VTDYEIDVTVEEDVVRLVVCEEETFSALDDPNETVTAEIPKYRLTLPDDPETLEAVGHALLERVAEQSSTGPPGQKPMHQQYAEAEPDR